MHVYTVICAFLFYFEMKVSSYMTDVISTVPGFIRNGMCYNESGRQADVCMGYHARI